MNKNIIPQPQAERMLQARLIRGLGRPELAELIGVTRQAISQYELGTSKPSMDVLQKYSLKLGMPLRFFMKEYQNDTESAVCFRKLKRTKEPKQEALRVIMRWTGEIVSYLKEHIDFPCSNIKFVKDKENYTKDEIEIIAEDVRDMWGLALGPIDNIMVVLENNGFIISRVDIPGDDLDACTVIRSSSDGDIRPYICMTQKSISSACRTRFNLAHELGHIVLHSWVDDDYLADKENQKRIEDEANYFAGAFSMPLPTFARELYQPAHLESYIALKRRWKMSIGAMVRRALNLRTISESQYQNLQKQISIKRMRKTEPLDDVIPQECPSMLNTAISLLIKNKILSGMRMADDFALPISEVDQICGFYDNDSPFSGSIININSKLRELNNLV